MSTEHAHTEHAHATHHHHHADASQAPVVNEELAPVVEDEEQPVLEEETDGTANKQVGVDTDPANFGIDPYTDGVLLEAEPVPAPSPWPEPDMSFEDKIENLGSRLANLENMVGSVTQSTSQMAMQFGQTQGALNQIGQILGQLSQRVNAMDPNRPILEITICQYQPVVDLENKEFAFKATFHGESHPEHPNSIDALRLDMSDPTAPHWVPVGVSPGLSAYIKQMFDDAGVAMETWSWVKLAEKRRPTGETADFSIGIDTSEPAPEGSSLSVEAADAVSTFINGEPANAGNDEL